VRPYERIGPRTRLTCKMPTEAHPTSKLAGTPISDDETVAKMGHPNLLWVIPGPPAHRALLYFGA
jgi:hypothetical protein